jgi:type VII secretion integral membrane protein EccD
VSDPLCRLTVQGGENDEPLAVDLALPRNTYVGLLVPSIVDLVHRDTAPVSARPWRLSPIGGPPLDESMTLNESKVRDGDLLLLTAVEAPAPHWVAHDPCHTIAHVDDGTHTPALRIAAVVAWLCAAGIGAAALAWSGMITRTSGSIIAGALVGVTAAVGAVVSQRTHHPLPGVALSVIAVVYTAVVGFLSVPAGPSAANALLAASASFAMAILLLRLTRCGSIYLTAIACWAALAATTATACVVWTVPAQAAGAALAVLSLAVLGVAARMSITVAGITPALPTVDDRQAPADLSARQVSIAHQTVTGLVAGSSASAALGSVLVACGELNEGGSQLSASLFTSVVGVVLLVRTRTHTDMPRRIALGAGAMISIAAGLAVTVISTPAQAHWIALVSVGTGVGALGWFFGLAVSPVVRRAIELLEYLALAAVLPLACWVAGLYGLIRGLNLT